jgi:methyl coenzyme M reductase subunit C
MIYISFESLWACAAVSLPPIRGHLVVLLMKPGSRSITKSVVEVDHESFVAFLRSNSTTVSELLSHLIPGSRICPHPMTSAIFWIYLFSVERH